MGAYRCPHYVLCGGRQLLEDNMKKIALAAALSVAATSAFAGGYSEPIVEAPVIVEETAASSSAGGIVVPLLRLLVLAAAAS